MRPVHFHCPNRQSRPCSWICPKNFIESNIVACGMQIEKPFSRTFLPVFLTWIFFALMKSNSLEYSSFSMLLNVCVVFDLSSTSKSKLRVDPPLRAKLTEAISSNRMWMGGLCTYMKPRSNGYSKPAAALNEQPMAGVPVWLKFNRKFDWFDWDA